MTALEEIESGLRILQLRRRAGLTLDDLARRIGVSTNVLASWERGLGGPRLWEACLVADALDCTLDELAGRNLKRGRRA